MQECKTYSDKTTCRLSAHEKMTSLIANYSTQKTLEHPFLLRITGPISLKVMINCTIAERNGSIKKTIFHSVNVSGTPSDHFLFRRTIWRQKIVFSGRTCVTVFSLICIFFINGFQIESSWNEHFRLPELKVW